jgi:hypothetical protein
VQETVGNMKKNKQNMTNFFFLLFLFASKNTDLGGNFSCQTTIITDLGAGNEKKTHLDNICSISI